MMVAGIAAMVVFGMSDTSKSVDTSTEAEYAIETIIDGTSLGAPFMIKNKPVSFKVPAVGEVQVLGTRDGGGGITYRVYYELNQTTYFNGMDQGGSNLYTLIRK